MDGLSRDLADHRFSELFQDALGWDQSSIKLAIEVNDQELAFEGVAQKCGFQVMTCRADRRVLGDEALLRKAQGEVARSVHNHILIYSCDKTPEQVWQWGVRIADGRGLRHTEHPFPAASPPDALLKRLNGLRFSVDERDGLSPVEGLHRVRTALVDLPIRKQLATRSDELAVAMVRGDNDAYHEFIMLHTGLARVLSKWVLRAYGVDAEDASQMGMLGLIEAARRFDPGHKIKFSTYANHWINKVCRYDGPNAERTIRISRRARRTFFPLRRQLEDLTVQHGPGRTRDELAGWVRRTLNSTAAGWPSTVRSRCSRIPTAPRPRPKRRGRCRPLFTLIPCKPRSTASESTGSRARSAFWANANAASFAGDLEWTERHGATRTSPGLRASVAGPLDDS